MELKNKLVETLSIMNNNHKWLDIPVEEVKKVKKSQDLKGVDGNTDLVKLLEEAAYFIEGVNLDELTHCGEVERYYYPDCAIVLNQGGNSYCNLCVKLKPTA